MSTEVRRCGLGCIFEEFTEVTGLPEPKTTGDVFNRPVGFKQEDFGFFDFFIVDVGYKIHIHLFFEKFTEVVVAQVDMIGSLF